MLSGSKMFFSNAPQPLVVAAVNFFITGLPDVSETRRMLGAWQKPKGMLVSLVQRSLINCRIRFSTGVGPTWASCAWVKLHVLHGRWLIFVFMVMHPMPWES